MRFIKGPVRWGIIGCGDVCEVKSGPALQKVPGSSLVAVMRRDLDKAKDFANRHHVGAYYGTAAELINDPAVNAVYVATPPSTHEAYAVAAMQVGKPVYIEKPVATDAASCLRLIEEAGKTNVPVSVAHYRRGLAIFRRVKDLINQGAIGACRLALLELFQAPNPAILADGAKNWRVDPSVSGGGLLFDLAPHQLDIASWLFGAPVTVKGLALNQGKHYAAPDVHALTAVFKNDVLFQGLWSFNSPLHACKDQLMIIGSTGSLSFPFFSSAADTKLRIKTADGEQVEEFLLPQHIQQPLIEEVVTYFQGKTPNPCSLDEALVSLMMIEKASVADPG